MKTSALDKHVTAEMDAKKLLQYNEAHYVNLAVQLRIADALERIADVMSEKVSANV